MQQVVSRPNPTSNNRKNSPSSSIVMIALMLFAVSGLMIGFAVGAFTHPSLKTSQPNTNKSTVPVADQTETPKTTSTVDVMAVQIGCPTVQYSGSEFADGNTPYTFHAQVMDKSVEHVSGCGQGKPLFAQGIMCRLWLTKDRNFGADVPRDRAKSVGTLQDPFPKEETNALSFDGSQTQPCNSHGETVWNYRVASSVEPGTYYLLVLIDWQGVLYNWTARQITITKAK